MLESFIVRAKMITQTASAGDERRALEFFRSAYPECPLFDDVEELFVLPDVIAHTHIWRIQFATSRGRWMRLLHRTVDTGSGDKKWRATVDVALAVTRRLKLKVQPTTIDRHDVAVVLDAVLATLTFINEQEGGRLGIHALRGDFLGEAVGLLEDPSLVPRRVRPSSTFESYRSESREEHAPARQNHVGPHRRRTLP